MSGGTFSVSRKIWDHEAFRAETFTEREAWLWIVGSASWKPRAQRVGDYVVDVDRGEFGASVRYMAKRFDWTPAKVQRYLKKLEKLKMIALKTDTGVTVVKVQNYDVFQLGAQASDTGPIQDRYRTDTKENKDVIRKKKEETLRDTNVSLSSDDDTPPAAGDVSEAVQRYNASAKQCGWPVVQRLNPNRSKQLRARLRDAGGLDGWDLAIQKAAQSDFICARTPKPWQGFGFDWLIKAANFTKLMEGNYDNERNRIGGPTQMRKDRIDPALEQIARLARSRQA